MTAHPHWEERLRQNREEHNELTKSLSIAVPEELCKAVARTEHVVGYVYRDVYNEIKYYYIL